MRLRDVLLPLVGTVVLALTAGLAAAAELIPPDPSAIELEDGRGMLIRLDAPADQIFIAEPEVADVSVKSPSLVYVFGNNPGVTTLYAVDRNERVVLQRTVFVKHNLTGLERAIDQYLPGHEVGVESLNGAIVLTGSVANASQAETLRTLTAQLVEDPEANLLNWVQVNGPNQVNLRVRIAEMSRDTSKTLGFNLALAAQVATDIAVSFFSGIPGQLVNGLIPNSTAFQFDNGSIRFDAIVDALEAEGLVKVLAEPNLTALSGESANFLAGGEFPIPVSQDEDTITIEFKEFGIQLNFRPLITGDNRISLRVRPEVSELSQEGAIVVQDLVIPALTTRRAETSVEMGSGQTFAIAGLLADTIRSDIEKWPFLADLPVLGALFRSDTFIRQETDLVILVTAYIVQPVSTELAAPTDGYQPGNDVERYVSGVRHRQVIPPGPKAIFGAGAAPLLGPHGYLLN